MATSLVLVVKTGHQTPSALTGDSTAPHESVKALIHHLESALIGNANISVDAHTSTTAPVAASGSIALTYANLDDGDTVTIGGVVLTVKASGANGTTQFNKQTNATVTGDNLVACIAANTTLSKFFTASNASGTVTITAKMKGSIGNLIVMSTSDATAYGLTQLAGGTGGAETTAKTYRLGL